MRDVWEGKVSAGSVLALVEQLNFNPYSRVRMIGLGGDPKWIGWDASAEATAATYDLILQAFTSLGDGQVSESDLYPRPGRAQADAATTSSSGALFAPTIDDFDPAAFMRVINGA